MYENIDKNSYTPMMRQYLEIKEQYPDTLVFFRLGDFYEMFFNDAIVASRELEIVLTGRDAGVEERVPMCGVPHHSVKGYIERLVDRGYKVGIVEQLEDPATAKGIVKRDVVQIITPGTLIYLGLQERKNNYLLAVEEAGSSYILSYVDLSTGEISVCNINKFLWNYIPFYFVFCRSFAKYYIVIFFIFFNISHSNSHIIRSVIGS